MNVITSAAELNPYYGSAFVPTMGALHEGHASLIRAASETGLPVVVSIFVNPKQFAAHEDLDRYPRTLEADLAICSKFGVDAVFAPSVDEIYPPGQQIEEISPGPLGSVLEGAVRPTHFQGVLTVVNRLFDLVKPKVAVFGKKDRQQLILIQKMVRERGLAIDIVEGPTIRNSDGLALSSRNRFLQGEDRLRALALPRALAAASNGIDEARLLLAGVEVDYFVATDENLQPVPADFHGHAIVLGAIRVGGVRLIDNMDVVL